MSSIHEAFTEQFFRWESRGRGGTTFRAPVSPAPAFVPFSGYWLPRPKVRDEGRKHTAFSGFLNRLANAASPQPPSLPDPEDIEPQPNWRGEEEIVELPLFQPDSLAVPRDAFEHFLTNVLPACDTLSFEIVGTPQAVTTQFAVHAPDAAIVRRQISAHFPEVSVPSSGQSFAPSWLDDDNAERVILEFALGKEFMIPLGSTKADPFVGLVGALSELDEGELGVYQVMFSSLSEPWAEHAYASVTDEHGKPFFVNRPELVKATLEKLSLPLFGAVVRIATKSSDLDRAWEIARGMASSLRVFARHGGNELFPLSNDEYPHEPHTRHVVSRLSRRSGMILNTNELLGFVHFPTAAVRSEKFLRVAGNTRWASLAPAGRDHVSLGTNEHAGQAQEVWLSNDQRVRHLHLMGGTGTGKSTLLFNLIRQDIENGEGLALLDPHGDLVEKVLGIIPPERIDDVVLIDPSDESFIVPFNILSAHSDFQRMLLASDLVSVFARWSTTWGDQMNSVFRQAVLAFLESSEGGTLSDLRRFLVDAPWREKFLQTVSDPDIRFYWKRTFPHLGAQKSIGPILTRLETLLALKPLRLMLSQRENKLDFAGIMDSGKILLAKLSQGIIGRENAFILGSLLVSKLQETAMNRQRMDARKRRPFFCYVDEFQNFICPSMAEMLSAARKYNVGLILAHQEMRHLERDPEVKSAVLANAFTRVIFRVSDSDARALAEGFAHFQPSDLQSLTVGQAICRIERADNDFNLAIPFPEEIDPATAAARAAKAVGASRAKYAVPRKQVEIELLRRFEEEEEPEAPKERRTKAPSAPQVEPPLVTKDGAEVVIKPSGESAPLPAAPHENMAPPQVAPELQPPPAAGVPSAPPAESGKGGHQHRIIQDRIKAAAEKRGFRVTLEMPLGKGREMVDVGLIRSDIRIACEISVTTTIDHEVGNVRKCLREPFDLVAVITANERRLLQIAEAVRACFASDQVDRVQFFTPEKFLELIEQLPEPSPAPPSAPGPTESTKRGFKVRRKFASLTDEERQRRNDAAFKLLAEEMRLPPE